MNSREKERFVAACKRAYFRYCRGDDAGITRVSGQFGVTPDQVVDEALDNRNEVGRRQSPTTLSTYDVSYISTYHVEHLLASTTMM